MIVATAGHVDHGKTALVRRLTGTDTDRLTQEKQRGLTIELGFAYRDFGARRVGFVDVPGHYRFINNMIAGIGGIDLGLLVVAADDGPMPQTREHLFILQTLGVREYAVTVTKIDRVDLTRVTAVSDQVLALFRDTGYTPPVFPISNNTGEGIDALEAFLADKAINHHEHSSSGYFRLPIDRSFVLKGKGLVVTGTAVSGVAHRGTPLRLLPRDVPVRVRDIHTQDTHADSANAGLRCALNIAGDVERETVQRGDWLVANPELYPTQRFDGRFNCSALIEFGLKPMLPVKLYLGARRVAARLTSLESGHIQPGESVLAQVISDTPVVCCRGDRFLIRDHSEQITLGGGLVLDPWAPRRGKTKPVRHAYLQAMQIDDIRFSLRTLLKDLEHGLDFSHFRRAWNLTEDEERNLLTEFSNEELTLLDTKQGQYAIATSRWQNIRQNILETVRACHKTHSSESGVTVETLLSSCRGIRSNLCEKCLSMLVDDGSLVVNSGQCFLPEHHPQLSGRHKKHWDQVLAVSERHGNQIPVIGVLADELKLDKRIVQETCQQAARYGMAVKISDNRFIPKALLGKLVRTAQSLAQEDGDFTAADFKKSAGVGRNFAIEFLEYLDATGLTVREGNKRRFLESSSLSGQATKVKNLI